MRTIFFGTPDFAVPTLAALVEAGLAPKLVVTQPARPVGRGHRLQDPPVAVWAARHELEVSQPEKVNRASFRALVKSASPDVAVVVAFGQIFRRRLLALPPLGCVNLHASLLPRHRGAAPIQAAIALGDTVSGVTTMRMTEGLDSGPMLLQEELEIGAEETAPELSRRLAEQGARLMVTTLRQLADNEIVSRQQEEDLASYAPQLAKADGIVDWRLPARQIYNRLRAYTPWPGQSSELRGRAVKLLWARPSAQLTDREPGVILGVRDASLAVACGAGTILNLERVQLPGKKPIKATDFANGARLQSGEHFDRAT